MKTYEEGQKAYHNGKAYEDNPYHSSTEDWFGWVKGWCDTENDYIEQCPPLQPGDQH